MSRTSPRIRIGVSSCLLGEEVRYDGGHKHDLFLTGTLARHFDLVPVCPEMAIGLGVPREPIQLRGTPDAVRVVGVRDPDLDVTEALREYGRRMAGELGDISGYIFKSRSPSCGMERVNINPDHGDMAGTDGVGQYAAAFMVARPLLPAEEEERLHDPVLCENFVERVFTLRRWQDMAAKGITPTRLTDFHTRHRLAVMAHGTRPFLRLGRLLAEAGRRPVDEVAADYIALLMKTLRKPATRRGHANVLEHLKSCLGNALGADDEVELSGTIDRYRRGLVPLIVPVTLLKHHFRHRPDACLERQVYLNPHPSELMLRNLL